MLMTASVICIPAPHYALVRESSVFGDAGGIHACASLFSGVKLDIDSLNAVLNISIEFATPITEGPQAPAETCFALSDNAVSRTGNELMV